MKIKLFTFNPFSENTYIIYNDNSADCVVIDPGCYSTSEEQRLMEFFRNHNLTPTKVLYTHCHLDHAFGAKFLAENFPSIEFYAHVNEHYFIENAIAESRLFGIEIQQPPALTHYVSDGEKIPVADTEFIVIHTPGHSSGGICYYCEKEHVLFCGDTLFAGSVGRSDLHGGNEEMLIHSIRQKLFILPDETQAYTGHGYPTTIGEEKRGNPYVSLYA